MQRSCCYSRALGGSRSACTRPRSVGAARGSLALFSRGKRGDSWRTHQGFKMLCHRTRPLHYSLFGRQQECLVGISYSHRRKCAENTSYAGVSLNQISLLCVEMTNSQGMAPLRVCAMLPWRNWVRSAVTIAAGRRCRIELDLVSR